jgi:hypothetical protein
VVHRLRQRGGRVADQARHIAAGVHHRVPAPPAQDVQPAIPIPAQLLHLREEIGIVLPAIEQRHPMPARPRGLHQMSPQEHGAAQDQHVHGLLRLVSRIPRTQQSNQLREEARSTCGVFVARGEVLIEKRLDLPPLRCGVGGIGERLEEGDPVKALKKVIQ